MLPSHLVRLRAVVHHTLHPRYTRAQLVLRRPFATASNTSSYSPLILLGFCALLGTSASVGYHIGNQRVSNHSKNAETPSIESAYGSPEDFQKAIAELKHDLPLSEEIVSTDPEVLLSHGFSMNDYHPGNIS